ncbi:MAG TPA: glycosyltransferase 87 family protein [Conexibacter sp.]|nr:glycosyltransferase 87 family protein [Conexibacter sp.]
MPSRVRRPSALLVALVVLLAAWAALSAARSTPHPLERSAALRAVLADARAGPALARGERWTNVRVGAVDDTTTRVTFFHGARLVAEVAVTPRGTVERFSDVRGRDAPYGAPIAHRPLVVVIAALAFLLATAVVPLRRIRNLDVAALLALVVPVLLLNERLLVASTLAALPSLLWLTGRCAWLALGPQRAPAPARPLLDVLTPTWGDAQRVRVLRLTAAVAAACVAMIAISAPSTVDVAQAVMEGGTLLVHGTLPYGHMPGDVFHGDVYPLLSYAAYAPLAIAMPVHDDWDVANGALIVAALSAIAGAWLLARIAGRASASRRELDRPDDAARAAGLRAALAWLTLPPLLVTVSTGTSDVLLGALLLAALALARRPLASVAAILVAGCFKVVPFALLPIWLARLHGRRLVVGLALTAGAAAATLVALIALGGADAPRQMLHAIAYQADRRTLHSPWTLLGIEWLQPLGQAAVLALVAAATVRVRRDAALAADPMRLAALAGAVLLGLQLTGNYWTYLYLAWVVPCIVVGLLADAPRPAPVTAAVPGLNPRRRNADVGLERIRPSAPQPS